MMLLENFLLMETVVGMKLGKRKNSLKKKTENLDSKGNKIGTRGYSRNIPTDHLIETQRT